MSGIKINLKNELKKVKEEAQVTISETKCEKTGFDYEKITRDFGVDIINSDLLQRFENVTGKKAHFYLKRGHVFAHRDLEKILDAIEKGDRIFIYTGRGPSSDGLHLGHLIPLQFTKYLQDVFNATVVIQISDDEKYYFKDLEYNKIREYGIENIKDIIAMGFDPKNTFIFFNRDLSRSKPMSDLVCKITKNVKIYEMIDIFGFQGNFNLGQIMWPIYQSAAAFSSCFESIFHDNNVLCLVPCAIDQDPYFRLCRDLANRIGLPKPCSIISKFLPSLEGTSKMSTTSENNKSTIFLNDDPLEVPKIIRRFAASGGKDTIKEHRKYGADLSVDMSYQYLTFFEEDDKVLNEIREKYSSGKMLTGEIKNILSAKIISVLENHQENRKLVTDQLIEQFMDINKF